VTSRIDNIEFQQGVWRYHPLTKRFELFCEGGGNSWGLDFDRDGNLIYSTNFSPYRMLHGVQGGYYWKSFGKHGALHNPYAYGYFDHVPHTNFQGGHVTVGGVIYQGNSFPAQYRGKYLNADTLGHAVYWNDIEPLGSSFRSINGPKLLTGNDTWFAPDDVTIGPDGAAYISDWYDKRTAHPDPDADWDRSNGRIYRIQAKGAPPYTPPDVSKLPSDALVTLLSDPNNWLVDRARRVLADRRDANVIPRLTEMVFHSADDHLALEAFWALYVSGGFNDAIALQTLEHRNPAVRRWTVRLLGDERKVSSPIARRLAELAANDTDVLVRSQLASTAKRLPATDGLPIVERLLVRDEDANDPHVPLLLWWAVEAHAIESRDQVMSFFTSPEAWKSALSRDVVLVRLVRRYAAEGTESSLGDCARLIDSAPSMHLKRPLIASLDEGLSERTAKISAAPISLKNTLAALLANEPSNPAIIRPLARLGDSGAQQRAATLALDPKSPDDVRVSMLEIIGEAGQADLVPGLLNLLKSDGPRDVQIAALAALKSFDSAQVTSVVLGRLPQWRGEVGARAGDLLLSRQASAAVLLQAIDAGTIPVAMVTSEQVRQVSLYGDRRLDGLVRKHWGNMQQSSELKLAEIRRLNNDLNAAAGDAAAGKVLFQNTCAVCHHLYDFGADVGPDLTHANRKDRDFLLLSIVDPSATIRSEYLSYIIHTTDGQVLTGLIGAQTPSSITLKGPANQRTTIERAKIKDMQESPVSLMPEGLLSQLKPQQVRDLFAYLQGDR
jgi:putative heme-binding domain-containing protein